MISEIQRLSDSYHNWLRDKTRLREVEDGWVEITTPYLDRHNDSLQIYVRKEKDGYVLTDDRYILDDLVSSGCSLDTPRRKDLLLTALNGYGVRMEDGALLVNASAESFPLKKHSLLQAMLAVNDMFYMAQPMVASLFYEDVVSWLDLSEVRYMPKVKFTGKTGFDYLFDFAIPKSRQEPERLLKAITHPTRQAAETAIVSWLDTREVRPSKSQFYTILNDSEHSVPGSVLDALRNYDINTLLWSRREESRQKLLD